MTGSRTRNYFSAAQGFAIYTPGGTGTPDAKVINADGSYQTTSGTTIIDSSGFSYKTVAAITASTTHTQAGATPITAQMNSVTTANASDAVVLPASKVGLVIEITNVSTNAGVVYGNGSDTINGTAGATGVAYAASKTLTCRCYTAGAWVTTLSN